MGARHRDKRPARRSDPRDAKPLILVVTEGAVTEPQYLNGLRRACRNPRVRVEIGDEHGVPRSLVEHARELKQQAERAARTKEDDNLLYDEVWCVFDVDEHPRIDEARSMAEANSIRLAISNPCFELWLVLHFRDSPGCQHRTKMQSMLATFTKSADKSVNFAEYVARYAEAVRRAERLDRAAHEDREEGRCPSTTVYLLTESIRGESDL